MSDFVLSYINEVKPSAQTSSYLLKVDTLLETIQLFSGTTEALFSMEFPINGIARETLLFAFIVRVFPLLFIHY